MFRSLRSSLARFAVRRAAACQRFAPRRADFWLRLACRFTPVLAEAYPALVRMRRAIENRWGALAVAQAADVVPGGRRAGGGRGVASLGDSGAGRAGPAVGRARRAARGEAGGVGAGRSSMDLMRD